MSTPGGEEAPEEEVLWVAGLHPLFLKGSDKLAYLRYSSDGNNLLIWLAFWFISENTITQMGTDAGASVVQTTLSYTASVMQACAGNLVPSSEACSHIHQPRKCQVKIKQKEWRKSVRLKSSTTKICAMKLNYSCWWQNQAISDIRRKFDLVLFHDCLFGIRNVYFYKMVYWLGITMSANPQN